jgi:hypothetical protein
MSSDKDRFFAAVCPHCSKKHAYDKQEECTKKQSVLSQTQVDEYYIICASCSRRFKVEIDCEGYQ